MVLSRKLALSKKFTVPGLVVLALLATAVAASAAPAYATGNVNVRSGPGTSYAVVDVLRRGEMVDVQYCQRNWCFINQRGPGGWVAASYLDSRGWRSMPPAPPAWHPRNPRPHYWGGSPRPRWYGHGSGASFCFNGPAGYFCMGN